MRYLYFFPFLLFCCNAYAQVVFKGLDVNNAGNSNPLPGTVMNGKLYFSATNASQGYELWVTDGKMTGTMLVKNINTGSSGSNPAELTVLNGKLVFAAEGEGKGIELWQSDGTAAGTTILKDMYLGALASNPANLKAYNGKVYFNAFGDNGVGNELWETDGTTAGTKMLKDINPVGGSHCAEFFEFSGRLFFRATTDANGDEVWVTDGTDTGTKMLKDISPSSLGSYPNTFTVAGGKLFFIATIPGLNGTKIFVTDGTTAGTISLSALAIGNKFVVAYNNELFVNADGGLNKELWKTNGTLAGSVLVAEITPGAVPTDLYWPIVYKNKLYFTLYSPGEGNEIWECDGTAAGTKLFKDLVSGPGGSNAHHFKIYKDKLYFLAEHAPGDTQLFISDGTAAGTHVLLNPSATKSNALSATVFKGFTEYDGELYFGADYDATGAELWSIRDTTTPISVAQVNNLNDAVTIYPNPAHGTCNIIIDNPAFQSGDVTLFDVAGRVVYQQSLVSGNKQTILHLEQLPGGIYTLKGSLDGNSFYKKLVLQ